MYLPPAGKPRAPRDVHERAQLLGLVTASPERVVIRDTYTPALIGLVSNMLVWGGSRVFHHLHGIGTNEWRVVSALANHPGATARELIEILGMNKSIASRSVNRLLELGWIDQLAGSRGSRHLYLTREGLDVHSDLMEVALRREQILHEDLSPEEVRTLQRLLLTLIGTAERLQDYEQSLLSGPPASERTTRSSNASPGV